MTSPHPVLVRRALGRLTRGGVLVIAFVLLATSAACGTEAADDSESGASTTSSTAKEPVSFTQADNGKEALLAVGEQASVKLETCGGCGYQWRVTEAPDAAIVESLPSSNQPRPTVTQPGEPPMVGVPTDEVFPFRGLAAGRTSVTIGYFPPAQDAPEESFTLTFVVA